MRRLTLDVVRQRFAEHGCELLENEYHNSRTPMKCLCKCGRVNYISLTHLMRGQHCRECKAEKCREVNLKHGHTVGGHSRTYSSWSMMMNRCYNVANQDFARYGGRGINVEERFHDFTEFLAYMGERPQGCSIDRIDNDKGYVTGNMRWATQRRQNRNQCRTAWLTKDGITLCMADWADVTGIPYTRIQSRRHRGLPDEQCLAP